jgi:UDPglucose--hexose-1-phosphate uridylyltransferase
MAEPRYNPLSDDWLMVASHRQNRPQMPKDWCPFCKGSGKVPDEGFDVLRYPNDFPALSENPPEPDDVTAGIFETAPAYGRCEVLLYSDEHEKRLWQTDHFLIVAQREISNELHRQNVRG